MMMIVIYIFFKQIKYNFVNFVASLFSYDISDVKKLPTPVTA